MPVSPMSVACRQSCNHHACNPKAVTCRLSYIHFACNPEAATCRLSYIHYPVIPKPRPAGCHTSTMQTMYAASGFVLASCFKHYPIRGQTNILSKDLTLINGKSLAIFFMILYMIHMRIANTCSIFSDFPLTFSVCSMKAKKYGSLGVWKFGSRKVCKYTSMIYRILHTEHETRGMKHSTYMPLTG